MKPLMQNKNQRARLFRLARLLDRVPERAFRMQAWFTHDEDDTCASREECVRRLKKRDCGFAGCAIGWAMTDPVIRGPRHSAIHTLGRLGMRWSSSDDDRENGNLLFGPQRKITARTVASDIRRYLKDGALPTK